MHGWCVNNIWVLTPSVCVDFWILVVVAPPCFKLNEKHVVHTVLAKMCFGSCVPEISSLSVFILVCRVINLNWIWEGGYWMHAWICWLDIHNYPSSFVEFGNDSVLFLLLLYVSSRPVIVNNMCTSLNFIRRYDQYLFNFAATQSEWCYGTLSNARWRNPCDEI